MMSLTIYIAHTGVRLETDLSPQTSLDELKAWIGQEESILASHQILITARGKLLRNLKGLAEDEVFVYDRNLFAFTEGQPRASSPDVPISEAYEAEEPPASLSDQSDLRSWQQLFKERQAWSSKLAEEADRFLQELDVYDGQAVAIQRAITIALERLKQNTAGLQERYNGAKAWVDDTLQEPKLVTSDFKDAMRRLGLIEADRKLLQLFRAPGDIKPPLPQESVVTLRDLIETRHANDAATRASDAIAWLEKQADDLRSSYDDLSHNCNLLGEELESGFASLGAADMQHTTDTLREETQAIVDKFNSDCDNALQAQEGPKTIPNLSRVVAYHTKDLLPSLMEITKELSMIVQSTVQRRHRSQTLALETMQRISLLEARYAEVKSSIDGLGLEEEEDKVAFDMLSFIAGLPSLYASVFVEIVRRHEWAEKMMADSSSIAEEMSTHRDDEERRRSRWAKGLKDYLQPEVLETKALDVDVNLKNQATAWPKLTRKDLDSFLASLQSLDGFDNIIQDLHQQIKSLDAPSKQQVRRSNAFKNGSIHTANFGRHSLLLRGDDEYINTLQTDKNRLEDRLKGSESRIRKLEDLLHRSSQASRPSVMSHRNSIDRTPTSPVINHAGIGSPKGAQENFSRHSSTSSRRVSGNYGPEERALAQRVIQLEAELACERSKAMQTQDHVKKQEDLKVQVQEATSMKKDLMDNFNAQQVEFDGERRLFTEENRKLKLRLEEMEEEVDRLLGSNDNAKLGLDERVQAHEDEVARVRQESSDEIQRLNDHLQRLTTDKTTQQNTIHNLDIKLQQKDEQLSLQREAKGIVDNKMTQLETQLQVHEEEREEHQRVLQTVYSELSEDTAAPESFSALLAEAESLSRKASGHLHDLKIALDSAQAEKVSYQEQIGTHEENIASLQQQHQSEVDSASLLREQLSSEKARFNSLEEELQDERKELANIRERLSHGETGSNELRSRVATEEEKAASLGMEVASLKSHIEQLEDTLGTKTKDLDMLQKAKLKDEHVLFERAQRAEKVSVLLFSQTDRLTHLLEHVGYNVSRQDDAMVIQRMPRSSTGSSITIDPSQSMNRSLSGPVPKNKDTPPDYIHWALANGKEQEQSQYGVFIKESQAFDIEAFSEAIVKRIKDTEHIARKWQREAKSYRDKSHRAQFESQNKIAFRSFREGDLALFLPTRNTAPNQRSWAAFNVGAPHYFLREQEFHRLNSRDWLLARISKVEERVVDLSRSDASLKPLPSTSSLEDDNPFGLSDGLRWYFLDASEEKLGAPTTPGLGKTTVASANVDAAGSIQRKKEPDDGAVTRTLAKSLDSRRSSGNSRKSLGVTANPVTATGTMSVDGSGLRASSTVGNDAEAPVRQSPSRSSIPEERSATPSRVASPRKGERQQRNPTKGKAWDSLWSLDLNLGSDGRRK